MLELPVFILPILVNFQHLFSKAVFEHVKLLLIGAIACPKQRTVAAILRLFGLSQDKKYSNYYYVLNRAKWSSLKVALVLFSLLMKLVPKNMPLEIIIDETGERRKGSKIKWLGYYRDAVRSTKTKKAFSFGLKWVCVSLLVSLPWSQRKWALPFLIILTPPRKALKSSKNPADKNVVRKSGMKYAAQAIKLIRRFVGVKRKIKVIADGAFCCFEICHACRKTNVAFICRMRWDACLYDFPPVKKGRGRPCKKGKSLPKLDQKLKTPNKYWRKGFVIWYGGIKKKVLYLTGTCLWYRSGCPVIPIRWMILKDQNKEFEPYALFSTTRSLKALSIAQSFIERWNIEVAFEEVHAHLGFGIQRGWADKTIERTTPAILGLFSITCLIAKEILKENKQSLPIAKTAWYNKSIATFSDVLLLVRQHLLRYVFFVRSTVSHDREKNPAVEMIDLLLECG
jgi:hypothetical protein